MPEQDNQLPAATIAVADQADAALRALVDNVVDHMRACPAAVPGSCIGPIAYEIMPIVRNRPGVAANLLQMAIRRLALQRMEGWDSGDRT